MTEHSRIAAGQMPSYPATSKHWKKSFKIVTSKNYCKQFKA